MTPEEMKIRTRTFALRVVRLCESLPKGHTADVIGRQLLRSACSVGANYRSACRAKSKADFISKMSFVEEELDESSYWMELLVQSDQIKKSSVHLLMKEASDLLAIAVASINTARGTKRPRSTCGSFNPQSATRNPQ